VLVITAAVLFYVALTDFKQFKIRNELILVLAGLFVVHALLSGRWVSAHWNLAFAALMFGVMFYFYAQNLMGGGDVKILTIGFLWVGFGCALPFAVLLAVFAAVHVVAAKFGWAEVQQVGDKKRIPLAPSVAAALILCFILGCLQPISSPTQLSHSFAVRRGLRRRPYGLRRTARGPIWRFWTLPRSKVLGARGTTATVIPFGRVQPYRLDMCGLG
jgi:prepilin peptidase CpaA